MSQNNEPTTCIAGEMLQWRLDVMREMSARARMLSVGRPAAICLGIGLASFFGFYYVPAKLLGVGAIVHGLLLPVASLAFAVIASLILLPIFVWLVFLRMRIAARVSQLGKKGVFCSACGKPIQLDVVRLRKFLEAFCRDRSISYGHTKPFKYFCSPDCESKHETAEHCWGCGKETCFSRHF